MSLEGHEVAGYDQPGELLVKSPSVVLGYLNNDKANRETFQDGYMRTGDEALIRKAPSGHEHVFVVDRIKELIKVKVSEGFFRLATEIAVYASPDEVSIFPLNLY